MQGFCGMPVKITASGVVAKQPCTLIGFLTTASTSGTVNPSDAAASGGSNIFTTALSLAAGTFTPCYMALANGLYVTVGGTLETYAIVQL